MLSVIPAGEFVSKVLLLEPRHVTVVKGFEGALLCTVVGREMEIPDFVNHLREVLPEDPELRRKMLAILIPQHKSTKEQVAVLLGC